MEPTVLQQYPARRYHRDGVQTCRVTSPEADAALGPDWADSPAVWLTPPAPVAPPLEPEPEPEPTAVDTSGVDTSGVDAVPAVEEAPVEEAPKSAKKAKK